MSKRAYVPGERHHWWPMSLSKRWTNTDGLIHRLDTCGKITASAPTNTACISNGHNIRLDGPWNTTFEQVFERPDANFPLVVNYLEKLITSHAIDASTNQLGFFPHVVDDAQLELLIECLVSLAVRSPKFRDQAIGTARSVRKEVPETEHKNLSAANIHQTYIGLKQNLSGRGKFLLIFSRGREFIFGDGFYNNIRVGSMHTLGARILVPLTPSLTVLYASPMQYKVEPRLVTLEADDDLLELLNLTVQVYSKDYLYFRNEKPIPTDYFSRREYLIYRNEDPINALVARIPGIIPYGRPLVF